MTNVSARVAKIALAAVTAGLLALAGAGVAGAAPGPGGHHLRHTTGLERRRLCESEAERLAYSARQQSRYAARTTGLVGFQARAQSAGNTHMSTYWATMIDNRDRHLADQQSVLAARTSRDVKSHGLVDGKCS